MVNFKSQQFHGTPPTPQPQLVAHNATIYAKSKAKKRLKGRFCNLDFWLAARAFSVPIESEQRLYFFVLTRFLNANRYPPRIKSGAGFRSKMLLLERDGFSLN